MPQRQGIIVGVFISPERRAPMQEVERVLALVGRGLEGDRYSLGQGSYNRNNLGARQVTLTHASFFQRSCYTFAQSRRNIIVGGDENDVLSLELYDLIGQEFRIGHDVVMRGIKYCDPCDVPKKLSKKRVSFKRKFLHHGGIVAEILQEGLVRKGDTILGPEKNY